MTVQLSIEQTPTDNSGSHTPVRDTLSTTAESYDEALDQPGRQIPAGWREVAIHVDRT